MVPASPRSLIIPNGDTFFLYNFCLSYSKKIHLKVTHVRILCIKPSSFLRNFFYVSTISIPCNLFWMEVCMYTPHSYIMCSYILSQTTLSAMFVLLIVYSRLKRFLCVHSIWLLNTTFMFLTILTHLWLYDAARSRYNILPTYVFIFIFNFSFFHLDFYFASQLQNLWNVLFSQDFHDIRS